MKTLFVRKEGFAKTILWLLCAGIAGWSATSQCAETPVAVRPGEYLVSIAPANGKVLLDRLSKGAPNTASRGQLASLGGIRASAVLDNVIYLKLAQRAVTGPTPQLAASPSQVRTNAEELQTAFAAQLGLKTGDIQVTPNYVGHLAKEPNDPLYTEDQQPYLKQIHMPAAWEIRTDATPIVVAVLDSGIMYTHEDLVSNIAKDKQGKVIGFDFYDNTADPQARFLPISSALNPATGRCEAPANSLLKGWEQHGTRVASIIGSIGNNTLGVSGIAWNVRIMPIRVAEDGDSCSAVDLASAVNGIRFAADHGAKIINASWEGFPYNVPMRDAIQYASDRGVLFVTAAGNHSVDLSVTQSYPQNYGLANMIVVSSVNIVGGLSKFSSFGKDVVDVAAPGEGIEGAVPREFLPQLTSYYTSDDGTSFASPMVAGLAALMFAANNSLSSLDVKRIILKTVDHTADLGAATKAGGVVNAEQAMSAAVAATIDQSAADKSGLSTSAPRLSADGIRSLESTLRVLPSGVALSRDQVAAAIPNRSGLSDKEYSDMLADLVTQSASRSSDTRVAAPPQKFMVEIKPTASATEVIKRASVWSDKPANRLDSKTFELAIKPSVNPSDFVNKLSNDPGVAAVYPTPTGTLIK
jgi:subtilisin family serine protease